MDFQPREENTNGSNMELLILIKHEGHDIPFIWFPVNYRSCMKRVFPMSVMVVSNLKDDGHQ